MEINKMCRQYVFNDDIQVHMCGHKRCHLQPFSFMYVCNMSMVYNDTFHTLSLKIYQNQTQNQSGIGMKETLFPGDVPILLFPAPFSVSIPL